MFWGNRLLLPTSRPDYPPPAPTFDLQPPLPQNNQSKAVAAGGELWMQNPATIRVTKTQFAYFTYSYTQYVPSCKTEIEKVLIVFRLTDDLT